MTDVNSLVLALKGSLNPEISIREEAENFLSNSRNSSGYGLALAQISLNEGVEPSVCQLAAVLLKPYVKDQWLPGNTGKPAITSEEKTSLKQIVLHGLGSPDGKLRTAFGVVISTIASYDWPEEWVELMPYLISAIGNEGNLHLVSGSVRCLALIVDDIDDGQLPTLIPLIFPSLLSIASKPQVYLPQVRRRALFIFHSCVAALGAMSGVFQTQTRALIEPLLPSWMALFAGVLSQPLPSENPDDWGLRVEAIRSLMQIVQHFSRSVTSLLPQVLGSLWQTFVSGAAVYQLSAVRGQENPFFGSADEDGTDQSISALIVQELEFLITLVETPRFHSHVENSCEALFFFAIGYMQITTEQESSWSAEPDQFVSDEDNDALSARTSACMLLDELVDKFGSKAIVGFVVAVNRRLEEGRILRSKGEPSWWKIREAALLAVGSLSEHYLNAKDDVTSPLPPLSLVQAILAEDLSQGVEEVAFLQGRALWCLSRLSSAMTADHGSQFLEATVNSLGEGRSTILKIGALRAVDTVCASTDTAILKRGLPAFYNGLGHILGEADEEVTHLALTALEAVVTADPDVAREMESGVTPAVLKLWADNVTDPVISTDAMDVLEAIASCPGCLEPVLSRAIPTLATILSNTEGQPEGLIAGALDLVIIFVKKSPPHLLQPLHDSVFLPVVNIALQSDDHSELQNSAECLASFLKNGESDILDWGGNSSDKLNKLLEVAARLLDPSLEGSAALYAGTYVSQLVRKLPAQMAPHLNGLLTALVRRMEGQTPTVKTSIILVFARLVHLSWPNLSPLLDILASIAMPGEQPNALHYVLSEWTLYEGDVMGAFNKKLSVSALSLLLACGDSRLESIAVQGRPVKATGIVTRARAKKLPEQWTKASFLGKVLAILADVLLGLQEAADSEDDWEECDGEDDDSQEGAATDLNEAAADASGATQTAEAEVVKKLLGDFKFDYDEDEESDAEDDPISKIDIGDFVIDYLKSFATKNEPQFKMLCQELSPSELKVVNGALLA